MHEMQKDKLCISESFIAQGQFPKEYAKSKTGKGKKETIMMKIVLRKMFFKIDIKLMMLHQTIHLVPNLAQHVVKLCNEFKVEENF
jgi:hypothetical protein